MFPEYLSVSYDYGVKDDYLCVWYVLFCSARKVTSKILPAI